jgi:LPS export ABC transporter protein LptC
MEKKAGVIISSTYKRIFIILAVVTGLACEQKQPARSVGRAVEQPDQEGWNSTVISTENGRKQAVVSYGHMARFNQKKLAKFDQGVQVRFYDEKGESHSTLTSDTGELLESSNDITARGHVHVVSDTLTLWTEELHYIQALQKIRSDTTVRFVTLKGDTLFGTGFESDSRLRNWQITNLHGIAHRSVDLSLDRLQKQPRSDSTKNSAP